MQNTYPPPLDSDGIFSDYLASCREASEEDGSAATAAHFRLGTVYARNGDTATAINCFRRAAEGGHAASARQLGELLVAGANQESGLASPETARAWLEEAAARGDVSAARPLADLLWGLNDPAAAPWLRQLAQEGDTESMVRLAELLLHKTPLSSPDIAAQ